MLPTGVVTFQERMKQMSIKNDPPYKGRAPRYPGPENPSSRSSSGSPAKGRYTNVNTPFGAMSGVYEETRLRSGYTEHVLNTDSEEIYWLTDRNGNVVQRDDRMAANYEPKRRPKR